MIAIREAKLSSVNLVI